MQQKIGLLNRYTIAWNDGELFELAEGLENEELLWLYKITKCGVLGEEIDSRKEKVK